MYDDYNEIATKEQRKLLREIEQSYKEATKELVKNIPEKDKRSELKKLTAVIVALWVLNGKRIIKSSESLMADTFVFWEYAAKNPLILTNAEISKTIGKIVKRRTDLIKWDTVIKSNAKRLDRKVSRIVKQGIKNSKTPRQIQAELEKTMRMNRNKAKTIARTESNYYKSESKYQAGKLQESKGNIVVKTWIYTFLSKEPRQSHMYAHGQTVVGIDGVFNVGGYSTKAPHKFGIASQDINCTCDFRMQYANGNNTSVSGFNAYKGAKT